MSQGREEKLVSFKGKKIWFCLLLKNVFALVFLNKMRNLEKCTYYRILSVRTMGS